MGKSTINGPFSIAFCMFTRGIRWQSVVGPFIVVKLVLSGSAEGKSSTNRGFRLPGRTDHKNIWYRCVALAITKQIIPSSNYSSNHWKTIEVSCRFTPCGSLIRRLRNPAPIDSIDR